MIDLHSHVLSGFDDGAENEQEMLEMCRMARQDGITTIVATPHCLDGEFFSEPEEIRLRTSQLKSALKDAAIDLNVLPGMEVRIAPDLPKLLENRRILTLNDGKYVLLELHPSHLPAGLENLLEILVQSGFGAIIAHPEKNLGIQSNPEYLYKLVQQFRPWDLLMQVTADSVTGASGHSAARTTKILLKHDLAHAIATDAHSSKVRVPKLSEALEAAASTVGEEKAKNMVEQIPLAVLGEGDFPEALAPMNPRRWWRIW